jgi:uncharacterized membrane protein
MNWLQRYQLRLYVRNSIWIWPVIALVMGAMLVRPMHWLERELKLQTDLDAETMRTVLGSLAGAMFTFIVFVCSSLLLVVQLASAQLTPRIIGVLFRDRVTKLTLSMFVFTFAFSMAALIRIRSVVFLLTAELAAYCSAVCLGLFLYLVDRVSKLLRPSFAMKSVAAQAHRVINEVYPRQLGESPETTVESVKMSGLAPARVVPNPKAGVVLAYDIRGLIALATRHNCIIEMVPQVGNYVAPGDQLFRVYGGTAVPPEALYHSIALGAERTIEQDATFGFRVIVDIASKGLSPAINDPTTAVLAVDQIHHLLRDVGGRSLENAVVRDAKGQVRLLCRTPDWEDFVTLAVTEIRQFGASSIQIARRLRAMLVNLINTLPAARIEILRRELKLLQRSADRYFAEPEDQARARIGDSQGVGGGRESDEADQPVKEGTLP